MFTFLVFKNLLPLLFSLFLPQHSHSILLLYLFGEGLEQAVVIHPVLMTSQALCGTDAALRVSTGVGGGGGGTSQHYSSVCRPPSP